MKVTRALSHGWTKNVQLTEHLPKPLSWPLPKKEAEADVFHRSIDQSSGSLAVRLATGAVGFLGTTRLLATLAAGAPALGLLGGAAGLGLLAAWKAPAFMDKAGDLGKSLGPKIGLSPKAGQTTAKILAMTAMAGGALLLGTQTLAAGVAGVTLMKYFHNSTENLQRESRGGANPSSILAVETRARTLELSELARTIPAEERAQIKTGLGPDKDDWASWAVSLSNRAADRIQARGLAPDEIADKSVNNSQLQSDLDMYHSAKILLASNNLAHDFTSLPPLQHINSRVRALDDFGPEFDWRVRTKDIAQSLVKTHHASSSEKRQAVTSSAQALSDLLHQEQELKARRKEQA